MNYDFSYMLQLSRKMIVLFVEQKLANSYRYNKKEQKINLDTPLKYYSIDSMDMIALIMLLLKNLNINLEDLDSRNDLSVNLLVKIVVRNIQSVI